MGKIKEKKKRKVKDPTYSPKKEWRTSTKYDTTVTTSTKSSKSAATSVSIGGSWVAAPSTKPSTSLENAEELTDEVKKIFQSLADKVKEGGKIETDDLSGLNMKHLKYALKRNDRPTTGRRGDLVTNVIDYITNGCPPRCPECGGGRLRFGKRSGKEQFYCPGFMEDTDFVKCDFTADKSNVERIPWNNPP